MKDLEEDDRESDDPDDQLSHSKEKVIVYCNPDLDKLYLSTG